ncbi:MAG TPA: Tex-like N-terminal domain-containing protein, partial [Flavitalea sp.]|nr:Tex-like N-terminal domain-containing protein [Flavitalea sp.]
MEKKYLQQIASFVGIRLQQVENVFQLHETGATVPFMARYRKEATGNLDEVQINDVVKKIAYFSELDKRKETVLKTIEAAGRLTEELRKRIEDTVDATILEDIYLPFKPKRKTKATTALEKGLGPLADWLEKQESGDPEAQASQFVSEQVPHVSEALQGARDIIAERISENEQARNVVRHSFENSALISSKVLKSKKEVEEAQKYRDY